MSNITPEKKMDPALKARWLEALRSGRYKQGRMSLKTSDGCFCCLGVALDVIDSGQWRDEGWGDHDEFSDTPRFDMSDTNVIGYELGIFGATCDRLAVFNDGVREEERRDEEPAKQPMTFAEIADWIEANL